MDAVDNPAFYDRHWERTNTAMSPEVVAKADRLLQLIPDDVRTIVDIGCGDGYLTHRLAERFEVTAVDRSEVALSRVQCRTVLASADDLPLPDGSADLVFASELIEHLPAAILDRAARELGRVSRRYLLLAVPNHENLELRVARCPRCGIEFHVDSHLHSFDASSLDALFPDYQRVETVCDGPLEPASHPVLERLRRRLARRYWVWSDSQLTCPKCGNESFERSQLKLVQRTISRLIDVLTTGLNRWRGQQARPYWLIALYRRRGVAS
ncbi:MAG: methyltransferase domain-containing protein [Deltaproteobacteria bacterium]|jgi:SAM-dependent methyltransferase|nr:methyltransferase domain-containing protein [Deltaproteobacteria bacterium]MBW2532025.1 methyltransferase domain-containing protein [Deltaproteobacteria bacterium]